jgi:hypothetical protein
MSERLWQLLTGPFTCTTCGKHSLRDSDAMQTVDGSEKQCRDCVHARVHACWAALPPGIYAIRFRDATGEVVATSYVRHGAEEASA